VSELAAALEALDVDYAAMRRKAKSDRVLLCYAESRERLARDEGLGLEDWSPSSRRALSYATRGALEWAWGRDRILAHECFCVAAWISCVWGSLFRAAGDPLYYRNQPPLTIACKATPAPEGSRLTGDLKCSACDLWLRVDRRVAALAQGNAIEIELLSHSIEKFACPHAYLLWNKRESTGTVTRPMFAEALRRPGGVW
jgi:hypothetical protein